MTNHRVELRLHFTRPDVRAFELVSRRIIDLIASVTPGDHALVTVPQLRRIIEAYPLNQHEQLRHALSVMEEADMVLATRLG